jgi:hypothetical protein
VGNDRVERRTRGRERPPSLEVACAELYALLLEGPEVDAFLRRLAELAASLVPGTRCVITLRRDHARLTGADVDALTASAGEVAIPDQRLPRRADATSSAQVDGGVSIPLVVKGIDIAVLRLFADSSRTVSAAEVERLDGFTRHASPALMLLLRQSAQLVLDEELQEALATRAVIDQALGVLMHAQKISSRQAFEVLRHASQATNRKVSAIAADVVETLTGHPPEPPRPLTRRDTVSQDLTGA